MISDRDVTFRSQGPGRFCVVLMVASVLSCSYAAAAEPVLPAGSPVDILSFVTVIVKLAVVLALIIAASWVLKRLQRTRHSASKTLEVLDVLPVGPKERILLVRAGGARLLIGSTPGRLTPLHRLDQPVALAEQARRQLAERAA